ncbi:kinase-like protein [Gonapodya prolifera JEL478]|uniref:Kinase-like protein n=1 Tax=Gonapodya prolifera (strain JEL478) TaxID=1344416 RepID=A0A139AK59_GONPJ|nr:kinase-like protein [Gonapodya prolifera JEL478]|eukprot:KXS16934.1 kinase-like protein [Gonapodya prolifera JEL478]
MEDVLDPSKRRWVDLDSGAGHSPFLGRELYPADQLRVFGRLAGHAGVGRAGAGEWGHEGGEGYVDEDPDVAYYEQKAARDAQAKTSTSQRPSPNLQRSASFLAPPPGKTTRRKKKKREDAQARDGWYEPPKFKKGSIFYGEDRGSEGDSTGDGDGTLASDMSESASTYGSDDSSDESPHGTDNRHHHHHHTKNAIFYTPHDVILPAPPLLKSDVLLLARESRASRSASRTLAFDLEPPTPTAESPSVVSLPPLSKNDIFWAMEAPTTLPTTTPPDEHPFGIGDRSSNPFHSASVPLSLLPPFAHAPSTNLASSTGTPPIPRLEATPDLKLFYVPLRKNLLGEGRYAQVFRGHYALPSSSVAPVGNPSVAPLPPQGGPQNTPSSTDPPSLSSSATDLRLPPSLSSSSSSLSYTHPHSSTKHPLDLPLLPCAVKRYRADPDSLRLASTESSVLATLRARGVPNVARMVGVQFEASPSSSSGAAPSNDTPPPTPYRPILVLDLIPGNTLHAHVKRRRDTVGRRVWLKWARQLARAVEGVHKAGVVHHDVKPQNVVLDEFLNATLIDFGNACFVPDVDVCSASIPAADRNATSRPPSPPATPSTPPSPPHATRPPRRAPPPTRIFTTGSPVSPIEPTPTHSRCLSASSSDTAHHPSPGPESSPSPDRERQSAGPTTSRPTTPLSVKDGMGRGTDAYAAPEMWSAEGWYSFPVDIYSLGITLLFALSGRDPWEGKSGVSLILGVRRGFLESGANDSMLAPTPEDGGKLKRGVLKFPNGDRVDREIEDLLRRCVARRWEERPTAEEVGRVLKEVDDGVALEERL